VSAVAKRAPGMAGGAVPAIAVTLAGAAWGAYWIPLRHMETAGLAGAWASIGAVLSATLVLLPFLPLRWARLKSGGWDLLLTGLMSGASFILYTNSLLLTEVVTSMLLFYLTPIWSTVLARLVLGQPITVIRYLTIALGFAGLAIVLGSESWLPVPRNLGDWMALVSGLTWAYVSVAMRRRVDVAPYENVFVFCIGGLITALLIPAVVMPIDLVSTAPVVADAPRFLPWMLLLGGLLWVPAQFALFWGVARLDPGRVGILLMAEVVVGAATAAILTDEPFGWRQILGGGLIVGAGFIDTLAGFVRRKAFATASA
jgi:drug/metabolite transporter (DMT)-like permease